MLSVCVALCSATGQGRGMACQNADPAEESGAALAASRAAALVHSGFSCRSPDKWANPRRDVLSPSTTSACFPPPPPLQTTPDGHHCKSLPLSDASCYLVLSDSANAAW